MEMITHSLSLPPGLVTEVDGDVRIRTCQGGSIVIPATLLQAGSDSLTSSSVRLTVTGDVARLLDDLTAEVVRLTNKLATP